MSVGLREKKGHGYSKAAAEVCKYALKFGDLSVEKTWEAFKVLKGKRLTGSFGLLWGVKIPDTVTDDMPDDKTLPYIEMLYKFAYGKKSYYDLTITRHVEPQPHEDESARASTSAIVFMRWRLRRLNVMCRSVNGHHQQFKRKKPHWRVQPKIRVRVRQRIRRWDGIMYNIDLFPYVEHRLLAFIGYLFRRNFESAF